MKNFLLLICAMLLTGVSALNAQNSSEKIQFAGTLINPTTTLKDYVIQVSQTGKDNRVLEEIKPEEDGTFYISVVSDRPVRLEVLDKKKKSVFRRTFFGSDGNHKLELNEIDLSKEKIKK